MAKVKFAFSVQWVEANGKLNFHCRRFLPTVFLQFV